jgi:hypothetical protein
MVSATSMTSKRALGMSVNVTSKGCEVIVVCFPIEVQRMLIRPSRPDRKYRLISQKELSARNKPFTKASFSGLGTNKDMA